MSSPRPLERTIDQVITKKESELLSQLNYSYLESINNLELSKSQLELEYATIISNAEKKAETFKRQVIGSSKLSSRNKELILLEQAVNDVFAKAKEKFLLHTDESIYKNLLIKMLDESIPNIATSGIVLECLEKDTDFFKQQIEGISVKYNKKIKLHSNLKNFMGGFRIKSNDGTITLNNTIDSRLERLKPLIRKNIAHILREGRV
ncbi:MAG TPA: V-type ATP synthase subunit E family protein [Nitrososphaeraceae archaeon]|jgi:V/A-type H+-transporting ATPase subunit E|nr:V-type ATP synthase subunit E family protein [Nitrososphaeraceae archaeon]